jgi:hypothetical protein
MPTVVSVINGGLMNCLKGYIHALCLDRQAKTNSVCLQSILDRRHLLLPTDSAQFDKNPPIFVDNWRLPVVKDEYNIHEKLNVYGPHSVAWNDDVVGADFGFHRIPSKYREKIVDLVNTIQLNPLMTDISMKLKAMMAKNNGKMIGIHIRSWGKSYWDQMIGVNPTDRHFDIDKYIDLLREMLGNYPSSEYTYCLCSDHDEHIETIEHAFPGVRFFEVGRELGSQGLVVDFHQHAFLDMLVLSMCNILIGKKDSTFTEMAWWWGGCKAGVYLIGEPFDYTML